MDNEQTPEVEFDPEAWGRKHRLSIYSGLVLVLGGMLHARQKGVWKFTGKNPFSLEPMRELANKLQTQQALPPQPVRRLHPGHRNEVYGPQNAQPEYYQYDYDHDPFPAGYGE